jgi:hypothetical protein
VEVADDEIVKILSGFFCERNKDPPGGAQGPELGPTHVFQRAFPRNCAQPSGGNHQFPMRLRGANSSQFLLFDVDRVGRGLQEWAFTVRMLAQLEIA